MKRLVTCLFVVGLVGCGASGGATSASKFPVGVHAGAPETDAEKAVARFIERYSRQLGKDAEWIEWGPNDEDGTKTMHDEAGKNVVIRVRYSVKPEGQPRIVKDQLYLINGEEPLRGIAGHHDNDDGAEWLAKTAAKKKAEEEAALKGPKR